MVIVSVLDIAFSVNYEELKSFDTMEEAENFVRSLYPELVDYEIQDKVPLRTLFRIVSKIDKTIDIRPTKVEYFTDIGATWMWLSNVRVNNTPVSRSYNNGTLSEYLIMPFIKSENFEVKSI